MTRKGKLISISLLGLLFILILSVALTAGKWGRFEAWFDTCIQNCAGDRTHCESRCDQNERECKAYCENDFVTDYIGCLESCEMDRFNCSDRCDRREQDCHGVCETEFDRRQFPNR